MAHILPFQPYRYSARAGSLDELVTQPYDKISPAMQARYLSLSPYNLVRIILGERLDSDTNERNVYTRAQHHLRNWIEEGILTREPEPAFFAYFQEFTVPDTGEKLVRKGFIGLGPVEDYSAGIVHRHEQTLSGPKKDRLELLRHTRAHFGQIFMLYADRELSVDSLLDEALPGEGAAVTDEYGTIHRLWRIAAPERIAEIQRRMVDKKLLIADGHHRYETALAFRKENPGLEDASRVMMTFVNMYSPGLKILATHRLVHGLESFNAATFGQNLELRHLASLDELKALFAKPMPDRIRIGIAIHGRRGLELYEHERGPGELDVVVLHQRILGEAMGISEEAVRDEKHIEYVRGIDAAYEKVCSGSAQVGFLLEPTTMQQVADVAFSGGVMPQKSTDFYPKLLSGLTIYKLEK